LIYTDIATDGMLQGPNIKSVASMVAGTSAPVISSGGVSSAADLCVLEQIEGLSGAIIGKALFDGLIQGPLRRAMAAAASEARSSAVSP
jgi:phosphoribosylformimino-5-aminoimidazole carboxamide ribonucleotide (ProFAR) isomerase